MKIKNRQGEVFETDIFSISIDNTVFEIRENFTKNGFWVRKSSCDDTDVITVQPITSNSINVK